MKSSRLVALLTVPILLAVAGCGKNDASAGAAANSQDEKSETVDVAAMDKSAEEELAASNKAEARQWLKGPSHAVFKGDKETVIKFVDEFYSAGATSVYVTDLNTMGGTEVTATVVVTLPKESAARVRLFEVANRFDAATESDPEKDAGQKYLLFSLD